MHTIQKSKFRQGFLTLTGSIIGAGFFALPYAMTKAGPIPGILIVLGLGILIIILHLILAEVSLSLPGRKTFVGLARELFPHRLAQATTYITIIQFSIGILAYTILSGTFLQTILADFGIKVHHVRMVLVYTIFISLFTWQGLKKSHHNKNIITIIGFLCIGVILISALVIGGDISDIPNQWQHGFSLYGIALFAMSSIGTIPIMYEVTGKSALTMRSVIILSGAFVTLCCIGFGLSIMSISGLQTTTDSIQGLYTIGGKVLGTIGSIMGLAAMISCHVPIASHLKDIFARDEKISPLLSRWTITLLPVLIYLYFDPNLIEVLSITGGLLGGLLTIIVALMNIRLHSTKQKVKIIPMIDHDQLWSWILIIICGVGVLYNILSRGQ